MIVLVTAAVVVMFAAAVCSSDEETSRFSALPAPKKEGKMSLEETLAKRRSMRSFKADKLTAEQVSQLCWATQGISDERRGFRTAPSAGALYPLELYVVTAEGVHRYVPRQHAAEKIAEGDMRVKLKAAALGQPWVAQAPATFVIAADVSRTAKKYGGRAERYVLMEVGHAAQNLLLQATAMGLGAVPVGAFHDKQVAEALSLPKAHAPMYLIPVGVPD